MVICFFSEETELNSSWP